ncbi:DUF5060 domain-containing protein [Chloroflexota bacterium]
MNNYRTRLILLVFVVAGLLVGTGFASFAYAQGATPAASYPAYERIEWTLPLDVTVDNPFDPAEIDVYGIFTPADGYSVEIPAFWMQPIEQICEEDCAIEVLEPVGDPEWRIRFTPTQAGEWSYQWQARLDDDVLTLGSGTFEVMPSPAPGFIRTVEDSRYFAFEDGTAYTPLGHNLAWSWDGAGGIFAYQRWLRDLAAAGGNYARLYIDAPWFISFEWESPVGDYTAAQDDFWRLDTILETAAEEGIYLDLVILWHQAVGTASSPPVLVPSPPRRVDTNVDWDNNPYNVINGGMLTSPTQFFREPEAQEFFKRRLRYLVARWGYSPNILAWDLLSAADLVHSYDPDLILPWLAEMSAYLQAVDPYGHLVTIGAATEFQDFLDAPGIDFGQVRFYQRRPLVEAVDQVQAVERLLTDALLQTDKPVLLTEFSLNPWYEPVEDDPTGIHVENTIWASMLSGAAGAGMSWWWDTYLEPQAIPEQMYDSLALYQDNIPWQRLELASIQGQLTSAAAVEYLPVRVAGYDRRFLLEMQEDAQDTIFTITPDGVIPDIGLLSSYVYGLNFNSNRHAAQVYQVNLPVDTRLLINVTSVSPQAAAQLVVLLDGETLAALELPVGSVGTTLAVPIPAGEHELVIDNVGEDWLEIGYLELEQYIAPLRILALADPEAQVLLAWFQNRAYAWENGDAVEAVPAGFQAVFSGIPAGDYRVEFFDPYTGQVVGEEKAIVGEETDDLLQIELLPIRRTLAIRVMPYTGAVLPEMEPTSTRPTATASPTVTLTYTPRPSATPSPTETGTPTLTHTPVATATVTLTDTTTPSPTETSPPTATPSPTLTPTVTWTPTNEDTATVATSPSPTLTATYQTSTPIPTNTAAPSATP